MRVLVVNHEDPACGDEVVREETVPDLVLDEAFAFAVGVVQGCGLEGKDAYVESALGSTYRTCGLRVVGE